MAQGITLEEARSLVEGYDLSEVRVGVLGSHSALDIADGAKAEGLGTVVVCQEGRETPYRRFSRLFDHIFVLPRFRDVLKPEVQEKLRELNTVFVPHRSLSVYVGYDGIEREFRVPLFGNRYILRAEERDAPRNQYYLLEQAGIRYPRLFKRPEEIDRPVMVKVLEAKRGIERAFFVATSPEDFEARARERIERGIIREEELERAVIEELVIGTYFNFNFFYSPLKDEVEFLGIDRRLQTNLHDFVNLPARQQLEIGVALQNVEIGHTGATIRESMLEKVFAIGDRFAAAAKREYPPGIIGPFALQSVVTVDLEIVVYDVSPRVPGSPILATTSPYTQYYWGVPISTGRRVALEIRSAIDQRRLGDIVT